MKKLAFLFVFLCIPVTVQAVWWNPFSWADNEANAVSSIKADEPAVFPDPIYIEKEVVKEVIKEVPVEKIVDRVVERIVEKPVEKIVTNTVTVDNPELAEEISRLKSENADLKRQIASLERLGSSQAPEPISSEVQKAIDELSKGIEGRGEQVIDARSWCRSDRRKPLTSYDKACAILGY